MLRIKHLKAPGKKCLIFNFQDVQTGRAGRQRPPARTENYCESN